MPQTPVTPLTANTVVSLHNLIKQDANAVDGASRQRLQRYIQKLANATQLSFAERALLEEQNRFLGEINNEAKVRRSTKATILDTRSGIIISYEDLVKAREDRARKGAEKEAKKIINEAKKAARATRAAKVPKGKKKRGRKRKVDASKVDTPAQKVKAVRTREVQAEQDEVELELEAVIPPEQWRAPVAQMW